MARYEPSGRRVIPILLYPCDWSDTPFAKLKALPFDGKPVDEWSSHDKAFTDVVKGIREVIQDVSVDPNNPFLI